MFFLSVSFIKYEGFGQRDRQKDLESSVEIMSKSPLIPSMSGGVGLGREGREGAGLVVGALTSSPICLGAPDPLRTCRDHRAAVPLGGWECGGLTI